MHDAHQGAPVPSERVTGSGSLQKESGLDDAAESNREAPLRPLTGGAVMSGVSRVVVAVTGAAATIFVARRLGPAGAGGFAIAQFLILVLTMASTLGVEHGIAYYVSNGSWNARSAYRAAQRVALASGLVGAGAGVLVRLAVPSAFGNLSVAATAAAAIALPFALSWLYGTYLALAVDHYEAYVLPPALQSMLALLLVIAGGLLDGLPGAVAGFTLAHVLAAGAARVGMRRLLASSPPRAQRDERAHLRRAVAFGIKGYAANALQVINYRLDLFVLASVGTIAEVGHYSVAVAVTGVMWLLPQALSDVLFPRIAALSARSGQDAEHTRAFVEAKSMRHTVLVTAVSTAAIALVLLLVVVPVYGAAFRPAVDLGLILLPGVALVAIGGTMSSTIVGRGRPGFSLASALIVTPLTVVLYLTLIPALHADGAALASSISYACGFLLACVFYERVTGESVLRRLLPTGSELADYRALVPAIRQWRRNQTSRWGGGS